MIRLIIVAAASIGLILSLTFFVTKLVRSRRRGLSIRLQVFIALATVIGTFAFGLGVMVIDRIEARAFRFASHAATEKAQVIAKLLGGEVEQYGRGLEGIARRLPARDSPHALEAVALYDASGKLLFRSEGGFPPKSASSVSVQAPIRNGGQILGRVQVVKTTIVMENLLADFAPTILVISLVLGAAAAISAVWIGHTIAGPIEALSEFARRVSEGETRAPAPANPQGREVTRLIESIDSMRRQLEGRPFVETFAADLSHELKNPVAAIRAAAEVLDDSALEEPEEARRFVRRILEAANRIERLLGELLSLAHIEARGVEGFEALELSTLLKTAAASLDQSRITLKRVETASVRGERAWLSRAISNLLENGLVHGEGGVRATLVTEGRDALLTVSSGGALTQHAQQRIFERFVTTRADKGGTGLGLAIVRAVAEAHRGQVEMTQAGPPDVVFCLRLPLA